MIDRIFVERKIDLISRDLGQLKDFANLTFDEVAKDPVKYAAVKNFLMEIIGRGIDINNHLISELADPKKEIPKTYKETFIAMGDLKILPANFAKTISGSAGFRNAIVHDYNNLDKQIIFETIGEAITQYSQYCRYILDFIDKTS